VLITLIQLSKAKSPLGGYEIIVIKPWEHTIGQWFTGSTRTLQFTTTYLNKIGVSRTWLKKTISLLNIEVNILSSGIILFSSKSDIKKFIKHFNLTINPLLFFRENL
jgi:hypothetical protein